MSDKYAERQDKHGFDHIVFVGDRGDAELSNYEILRHLNGLNKSCDDKDRAIASQAETIAKQQEQIDSNEAVIRAAVKMLCEQSGRSETDVVIDLVNASAKEALAATGEGV